MRRFTGWCVAWGGVAAALLFSGPTGFAQSGSYTMEVISANHQDVSPPLKNIAPLQPDTKAHREHPLHPIHPLRANASPAPDAAVQQNTSTAIATTAGLNFDGLGQGEYGFNPDAAPPDTNASVGAS